MNLSLCSVRGFTLIELIVAMSVFIIVLMITAGAFNTVLTKSRVTMGSEVTNIEGVVGLEMLRRDLQQAGYGLLTDEFEVPIYPEAANPPFSNYNDSNKVPRAIVTDDNITGVTPILDNTDYLVIKGTTVARTGASQRWSYLTDSGIPRRWGTNDFANGTDKVIVVAQRYDKDKNEVVRSLQMLAANNYAVGYHAAGNFTDMEGNETAGFYTPPTAKRYYLYGITGAAFPLRAPFNRTDYVVRRIPNRMSASCSPATGNLYKETMSHGDGLFDWVPVLDCVLDMQVVLGWNTAGDPENDPVQISYTNADGSLVSGAATSLDIGGIMQDSRELRRRLRLIKVYILAQDGVIDRNFVNSNADLVAGDEDLGERYLTGSWDLTRADLRNYRWKLHRVVVRPGNL